MSTPVYVTKFGNIQGINPGVEAFVNQQIKTAVEPLVTGVGSSVVDTVPRYTDNTGKKIESTNVTIDEFATLYVPGGVNIGNQIAVTDYYLPGNRGLVGQVMTMYNANSATWADAPPVPVPTFVENLTVTNLSQGTSALNQNYRLPTTAPPQTGTTYAMCNNAAPSGIFPMPSSPGANFIIYVDTVSYQTTLTINFQPSVDVTAEFLINRLNDQIGAWYSSQGAPQGVFVGLDLTVFPYRSTIQAVTAGNRAQVFVTPASQMPPLMGWPVTTGLLTGPATFTSPNVSAITPVTDSLELIWRDIGTNSDTFGSYIRSGNNASSVTCNELGDIMVSGSFNMGLSNLNEVGSINTTASTLNITTPTTQITNGSGDVVISTSGTDRLMMQGNYTSLRAGTGVNDRFDIDGLGAYIAVQGNQIFYANPANNDTRIWSPNNSSVLGIENTNGIKINGSYYLPTIAGVAGQVLTSSGLTTSWQTPQIIGLYSQTSPLTVSNTAVESTLIGAGVGSLTVPANYFTTGMAFRYSTGGVFRDNVTNTVFRFRLRNSGVLFDSGLLTLPLISTLTPWNIDVTFSFVGGTTMVTNFNFQYNNGSDARGFTSQNVNNTFNPTIINTLNFTVQWSVANVDNLITTNYGVLQKIF